MMRSPIPKDVREQLNSDPLMKRCMLEPLFCKGRIQWHHGFSYAGKRQNEIWCIVPLCELHHKQEAQYVDAINSWMFGRVLQFDALESAATKYPKSALFKVPKSLPTNPVE